MARKGQAVFQLEINSDEEWKLLIAKPGLIVSDVYSEWCGPCLSMMSSLKKIKVEVNSEYIIFTMCNANKITDLERFRGTSEPTWIFIASYQLLLVMYGCNAPELKNTIMRELNKELLCIEGKADRIKRPISTPAPEEAKKIEDRQRKLMIDEEETKKETEIQWDKVRHRYYGRIARQLTHHTVMVTFPHTREVLEDGSRIYPPSNKLMGIYDTIELGVKDQLEVQLTNETIPKMFYNSGILYPKLLLESLEKMPVIATLLGEYEEMSKEDAKKTPSRIKQEAIEHLDDIETRCAQLAYGESMNPLEPSPKSTCHKFLLFTPQGNPIPPIFTPMEHVSKAAAIEVLFPAMVEKLQVQMEPLPPPSYVVVFEGNRAREVLDTAAEFAPSVLHVAFFDSQDADEAEFVCQTVHEYERLPKWQRVGVKMVIAVEKTTSEPMLMLAQMGPVYMSSDPKTGLREVETFFPPLIDPVLEPDPWGPPPEDLPPIEEEAELEEEVEEECAAETEVEVENELDDDDLGLFSDLDTVDEGPRPSAKVSSTKASTKVSSKVSTKLSTKGSTKLSAKVSIKKDTVEMTEENTE